MIQVSDIVIRHDRGGTEGGDVRRTQIQQNARCGDEGWQPGAPAPAALHLRQDALAGDPPPRAHPEPKGGNAVPAPGGKETRTVSNRTASMGRSGIGPQATAIALAIVDTGPSAHRMAKSLLLAGACRGRKKASVMPGSRRAWERSQRRLARRRGAEIGSRPRAAPDVTRSLVISAFRASSHRPPPFDSELPPHRFRSASERCSAQHSKP